MATAIGESEKCQVCGKNYNPRDPLARSPSCSEKCQKTLAKWRELKENHRKEERHE